MKALPKRKSGGHLLDQHQWMVKASCARGNQNSILGKRKVVQVGVLHQTLQSVACNTEVGLNFNKEAKGRLIRKIHS